MRGFHGILTHEYGQCEPDCSLCATACILAKSDGKGSRIQTVHIPEKGFHGVVKCLQCSQPSCIAFCPTGAITRSSEDGIVSINENKCVGCGLCTLGCPYGGIFYDPELKKSYKCDKCGGDPQCTKACQQEILQYRQSGPVIAQLDEELQSHGIPMCQGCGEEIAIRIALRVFGKNTMVFGSPGCSPSALGATNMGSPVKLPSVGCYMTNNPAVASGVKRYLKRIGQDTHIVCIAGDGVTADVGFQTLSGAAERGESIIYICLDNEAYMNTGIQRSGTTPMGAWTTTTPVGEKGRGKPQQPKYVPLLMAFHKGVSYVGTATPYFLEDYVDKLIKARSVKDGLAYLHVLTPCPTGWRSPVDGMYGLSKLSVETRYFPLWEADHGRFRFTYMPKRPKPVRDFIKLMKRFSHLTEEEMQALQEMVDARYHQIQLQCMDDHQP